METRPVSSSRFTWLGIFLLVGCGAGSGASGASADPGSGGALGGAAPGAGAGASANGGRAPSAGGSGATAAIAGAAGSASTTGGNDASGGADAGGAGAGGSDSGGVSSRAGSAGSAGASSGGRAGGASAGDIPEGYVKGLVAVGYGGLRVVSRDGGQTWGDAVDYGDANADDQNLLRAVAYGKGRWIATGWKLVFSDDGVNWTEHSMVHDAISDQQIIEGLAYKDGFFYAAGDPGKLYRSADGLSWERINANIGNTQKHTALAWRGGLFVAYGDSNTSFQSSDGSAWTSMSVSDATYCEGQWRTLTQCHDAAWFDGGFYLHAEWGGEIQRSTDGASFKRVYADPKQHTAYKSFTFAEGYVRP